MERYIHKSKYYNNELGYPTDKKSTSLETSNNYNELCKKAIIYMEKYKNNTIGKYYKEYPAPIYAYTIPKTTYEQFYTQFYNQLVHNDSLQRDEFKSESYKLRKNKSKYWTQYSSDVFCIINAVNVPLYFPPDMEVQTFYNINPLIMIDILNAKSLEKSFVMNADSSLPRTSLCKDIKEYTNNLGEVIKPYETIKNRCKSYKKDSFKLYLGDIEATGNNKNRAYIKANCVDFFSIYFADFFDAYKKLLKTTKDKHFGYTSLRNLYNKLKENVFNKGKQNQEYLFNSVLCLEEALIFDKMILPHLKDKKISDAAIIKLINSINQLDYISSRIMVYKSILNLLKYDKNVSSDLVELFWSEIIEFIADNINELYSDIYNESFNYTTSDNRLVYNMLEEFLNINTSSDYYMENSDIDSSDNYDITAKCNRIIFQQNLRKSDAE